MIWPFVKGQSPNLPQTIDSGYNIHGECIVSAEMAEILWDAKEVKAISTMKRDITLIFRVTIAYEDTIGRRRQTSAYREYDFATERFRRVEDPNSNTKTKVASVAMTRLPTQLGSFLLGFVGISASWPVVTGAT